MHIQDYSQTPPAQELIAKDLHGNEWKFRHIFRGEFSIIIKFFSCVQRIRNIASDTLPSGLLENICSYIICIK